MKTRFKLVAGFAALALSFAAHAAPVDLFSLNQGPFSDLTPTPGDTASIISAGAGGTIGLGDLTILGGNRDLFVSLLDNAGDTTLGASIGVNAGVLSFNVDAEARARGQIQWDGADGPSTAINYTGLMGTDITAGGTLNAFLLGIRFSDQPFNFEVTAYSDENNFTTVSFIANEYPSPGTSIIPFSAFTNDSLCGVPNPAPGVLLITCGGAGANLASLGALVVDLDRLGGTTAIDLRLDFVQTVPEPGILALLGIGLMGLVGSSRRRKNVA